MSSIAVYIDCLPMSYQNHGQQYPKMDRYENTSLTHKLLNCFQLHTTTPCAAKVLASSSNQPEHRNTRHPTCDDLASTAPLHASVPPDQYYDMDNEIITYFLGQRLTLRHLWKPKTFNTHDSIVRSNARMFSTGVLPS